MTDSTQRTPIEAPPEAVASDARPLTDDELKEPSGGFQTSRAPQTSKLDARLQGRVPAQEAQQNRL